MRNNSKLVLVIILFLFYQISIAHTKTQTNSQNNPEQEQKSLAQNTNKSKGVELFEEAEAMLKKRTAESLRLAIEKFKEALPFLYAENNKEKQWNANDELAFAYFRLGDNVNALEYGNKSLSLAREINNPEYEIESLNTIGNVYNRIANNPKALEAYNNALAIAEKIKSISYQAQALSNIGSVYNHTGENQKALDYFNKALPLRKQANDKSGEAATLNNIAGVYSRLGDFEKALSYYNRALPLRREVKDIFGELATLTNIGTIYSELGETQKVLESYNQILILNKHVGDKLVDIIALSQIGTSYLKLDNTEKALEYCNEALSKVDAKDSYSLIRVYARIGDIYKKLKETNKALEFYNKAFVAAQQILDRYSLASTLYSISSVEFQQNNLKNARTHIEKAIEHSEFIRSNVVAQNLRTSYSATIQKYYDLYIEILMTSHKLNPKLGFDKEAFQISEKARARTLLELMAEAKVDIKKGVDLQLLEKEKILQEKLNAKEIERSRLLARQYKNEEKEAINKEIEEIISNYRGIQTEIREKSPLYATITQSQPLSIEEIQGQILDNNTILLEYWLGEEHSYLWALTPNTVLSYELAKGSEIEPIAKRLYEILSALGRKVRFETPEERQKRIEKANAEYPEVAKILSTILLAQVSEKLEKKRLVVVTQGILQYIPFSVLPLPKGDNNQTFPPLIIEHEIVSLPSISVIKSLQTNKISSISKEKTIAIWADPVFDPKDERLKNSSNNSTSNSSQTTRNTELEEDLELNQLLRSTEDSTILQDKGFSRLVGTRIEANAICSLVAKESNVLLALDFDANHNKVLSTDLSQYKYIHFATHGLLNEVHPELSGLVFSLFDKDGKIQNGFLRLNEVFNLTMPVDMVVLSACQTGLGKDIKGEGIIGLTRGFMYAGAERVLVSLWNVNDKATSELMKRFYEGILKDGLTPTIALRNAQVSLLKEKEWSSPHFWAPFIIQGSWK